MKKLILTLLVLLAAPHLRAAESWENYQFAFNQYLDHNYMNAAGYLQYVLKSDPNNWQARQLLGYSDYFLNRNSEAVSECQESLKFYGDNPRLRHFTDWLSSPEPRAPRTKDASVFFESRKAAEMPPPPDLDPDRKLDRLLKPSNESANQVPLYPPWADNSSPSDSSGQRGNIFRNFLIEAGAGVEYPGQNFNEPNQVHAGGEVGLGYALDNHWSLWLREAMYFYTQRDIYDPYDVYIYQYVNSETTLSARYAFGDGPFQPFVGAGVGVFLDSDPGSSFPMIQGSLGGRYRLNGAMSVFFELKGNFIFEQLFYYPYEYWNNNYTPLAQPTLINYPLNAGVILDLWGADEGKGQAGLLPPGGNFFVQTGIGSTFNTAYYYPNPLAVYPTSFSAGYDFPNHFSFFASVERFPGDWALLANLKFTLAIPGPVQPYAYLGLGTDFPCEKGNTTSNLAAQAAVGLDFILNNTLDYFAEVRTFSTSNDSYFWDSSTDNTGVFVTGMKFNFSQSPNQAAPSPNEPAHPNIGSQLGVSAQVPHLFVELAGRSTFPRRIGNRLMARGMAANSASGLNSRTA